uniref:Uncharacterized protein n=1 Tax=Salix viminalis TaxID=40686 RepID=A0A6N2LTE1_SALVM
MILNSKKYKGRNLWNLLQNLPRVEIGGAAMWLLLLVTTCWSCTAVLQILRASTLSKFSTMNIPFLWRVVMVLIFAHLKSLRKK